MKTQKIILFMPRTGLLFATICILTLGLSMPWGYGASKPPPASPGHGSGGSQITVAGVVGFNYPSPTTFSNWQSQNFNSTQLTKPSISGATATPAGDGVTNLMKYALDLTPFVPTTTGLPTVGMTNVSGSNYLTLIYTQVIADTDISYTVQVSGDLKTWNSGSSYTSTVSTTINSNGTETVVVQDLTPISTSATKRFIQLEVTLP
jgi:hypothetical protein